MEFTSVDVDSSVPDELVDFVGHFKSELTESGEFDCVVSLETIAQKDASLFDTPLTTPLNESECRTFGLQVVVEFDDASECPTNYVSEIAESYYSDDVSVKSKFEGGDGRMTSVIFPLKR